MKYNSPPIIEAIFDLRIDKDENIVFTRNSKKQIIEYVYEALEEKKKPLTVFELLKRIKMRVAINRIPMSGFTLSIGILKNS